jgi:hypothetical protein
VSARKHARRRMEAEFRARARILPDVSTRSPPAPSRIGSPFRAAIDAYRQTPESWLDVWDETP